MQKTKTGRKPATRAKGPIIEVLRDHVIVSRKWLDRVLEDLDDLRVTSERLKEKPISLAELKKRLET